MTLPNVIVPTNTSTTSVLKQLVKMTDPKNGASMGDHNTIIKTTKIAPSSLNHNQSQLTKHLMHVYGNKLATVGGGGDAISNPSLVALSPKPPQRTRRES